MAEIYEETRSRLLRLVAMVIKELKGLLNDKSTILILFLVPILTITVLSTSRISTNRFIPTIWIIDYDDSSQSQEFVSIMKNSSGADGVIQVSKNVYSTGELAPVEPPFLQKDAFGIVSETVAQETISSEYLDAYLILPEGFEEALNENGTVEILMYLDAIDFMTLIASEMTVLVSLTEIQIHEMLLERDIYYYPELRPDISNFGVLVMTASLIIPLLGLSTMLLISCQSVVGDFPLKRMLNTSLRRGEVISGKIISYSAFALIQVLVTLLLLSLFNIKIQCLWIELFIVLLLNSLVGICMGVCISTISQTKLQASQIFLMFFFLMFIFQYFTRTFLDFLPLEQTKIAYQALANRGMHLFDPIVSNALLKLALNGLFYFLFAVVYIKYFKRRFV